MRDYTDDVPERPCDTCVQFGDICCNYRIRMERTPFINVYPGYAIVKEYPNPYPPCEYHETVEEVKARVDERRKTF